VGALHVPFLVVAPTVRAGVRATGSFSHYSLLRTTLEMLRLRTDLGQAATAPSMRASFGI
jgi:phosphatidylinositol-3-phosphatase